MLRRTKEGDLHFIVGDSNQFIEPQKDQEYSERIIASLDKHFKIID